MTQYNYEQKKSMEFAEMTAAKIEKIFNTKVYAYGCANKREKEFQELTPLGVNSPDGAGRIFWFLIPIDDEDNVVTNDYYEKLQNTQGANDLSIFGSLSIDDFQSILREDSEISNYLSSLMNCQIFSIGAVRVSEYSATDNVVANIKEIEDVRYRYFKFYTM